ncbi:MAG: hypothetical protein LUC31_02660 [Coprobacillus sp.]|nr:hypothetical protein [Coprobacillus sp.]
MFVPLYANSTVIILVSILAAAVVIGIIAYVVYRYTRPKLKNDKPSEEEVAQEELDRLLTPIEDEETLKEMSEYALKEEEEEQEDLDRDKDQ